MKINERTRITGIKHLAKIIRERTSPEDRKQIYKFLDKVAIDDKAVYYPHLLGWPRTERKPKLPTSDESEHLGREKKWGNYMST
jgi:hypothetical protein